MWFVTAATAGVSADILVLCLRPTRLLGKSATIILPETAAFVFANNRFKWFSTYSDDYYDFFSQ